MLKENRTIHNSQNLQETQIFITKKEISKQTMVFSYKEHTSIKINKLILLYSKIGESNEQNVESKKKSRHKLIHVKLKTDKTNLWF